MASQPVAEETVRVPGPSMAMLHEVLQTARPGQMLLKGVRLSAFNAICAADDARGLGFVGRSSSPDPRGDVLLTADPTLAHERATQTFMVQVFSSLLGLGVWWQFLMGGSARLQLGPTRNKEPDACLHHRSHAREGNAPVLVVDSARSQTLTSLLSDIDQWVMPRALGGGAALAIGLHIKPPTAANPLLGLVAYVASYDAAAGGVVRSAPLQFGGGTACGQLGDPRFFLWLPLALLLPGCPWWRLAWLALLVAARGLVAGLGAFMWAQPPSRACAWALARCRGPWGTLPVDLGPVRDAVEQALKED